MEEEQKQIDITNMTVQQAKEIIIDVCRRFTGNYNDHVAIQAALLKTGIVQPQEPPIPVAPTEGEDHTQEEK